MSAPAMEMTAAGAMENETISEPRCDVELGEKGKNEISAFLTYHHDPRCAPSRARRGQRSLLADAAIVWERHGRGRTRARWSCTGVRRGGHGYVARIGCLGCAAAADLIVSRPIANDLKCGRVGT